MNLETYFRPTFDLFLTYFQERPFVHNSVCSQFLEGLFAILPECLQFCLRSFEKKEIQEEIHHLAGWEGGGFRGIKIVNKIFVNKLAFPILSRSRSPTFDLVARKRVLCKRVL